MKITYHDGSSETCAAHDLRQIAVAGPTFDPNHSVPHLTRVWDNPRTYAKLALVECRALAPDHWVMTRSGLKLIARVKRDGKA